MKQILVKMAVVLLVEQSVLADENLIADPIVEKAVRKELKKPEGQLTVADLAKVTVLGLTASKSTDEVLKEVAKLQNLLLIDLSLTQITDEVLKEVAQGTEVYRD